MKPLIVLTLLVSAALDGGQWPIGMMEDSPPVMISSPGPSAGLTISPDGHFAGVG